MISYANSIKRCLGRVQWDGERSKTSTCSTVPPPPPLPKPPWMEPRRPAWKPNPTVRCPTARRRRCEGRRRLCRAGRTGRTGAGGRSRLLVLFPLPKHPGKCAGTWEARHTPRESHPGGSHRSRLRQHRHKSSFLTRPPQKSAGAPIPTVSRFHQRFVKGKVRPRAISKPLVPMSPPSRPTREPKGKTRHNPEARGGRSPPKYPQKTQSGINFLASKVIKINPTKTSPLPHFGPPNPTRY